jgi:hypothetical protein
MNFPRRSLVAGFSVLVPVATAFAATPTSDPQMDRAAAELRKLVNNNQAARELNEKALAVLVFPRIVKVGFLLGGAYGEGAMTQGGRNRGILPPGCRIIWLAGGLSMVRLRPVLHERRGIAVPRRCSQGFEIGLGPSVVVVDWGMAKKMTLSTTTQDIYAMNF